MNRVSTHVLRGRSPSLAFCTGHAEDNFHVIESAQRNARFLGADAKVEFQLDSAHWLDPGMDPVDAQDTDTGTPLPRIPRLRAKVGLAFNLGGFRIDSEPILACGHDQTFIGLTPMDGYEVVNPTASNVTSPFHFAYQFSGNVFNLGDRL